MLLKPTCSNIVQQFSGLPYEHKAEAYKEFCEIFPTTKHQINSDITTTWLHCSPLDKNRQFLSSTYIQRSSENSRRSFRIRFSVKTSQLLPESTPILRCDMIWTTFALACMHCVQKKLCWSLEIGLGRKTANPSPESSSPVSGNKNHVTSN